MSQWEACWRIKLYHGKNPSFRFSHPAMLGRASFEEFARARPADYTFLEPQDFSDLRSSAFAGIAQWDSFAEHVIGCTLCGEV
jgi:hypothetical protein